MDRQAVQERFGIIGSSPAIRQVIDRTRQVARTDISVLIEGESGVGKELIAQAIHELSPRRHSALKVINTGAIPEGLIESELFGAEKGAYTGASDRRTGLFEEADGGSVFLDEIGEMPPAAQVRLLRVLETGSFNRVGSSRERKTDTRVIAATNKVLGREVEAGRFREDLYYRLSTVIIRIPPLRERAEDIYPIFDTFLHQFTQKYGSPGRRLDDGARQLLRQYRWPGNVRELRNVAEQVVVLHRGAAVNANTIRPLLRGVTAKRGAAEITSLLPVPRTAPDDSDAYRERELIYRMLLEIRLGIRELKARIEALAAGAAATHTMRSGDAPAPESRAIARLPGTIGDVELLGESNDQPIGEVTYAIEPEDDVPGEEDATLASTERALILNTLKLNGGNRRQTAKALGISERTLYRKIKSYEADGL